MRSVVLLDANNAFWRSDSVTELHNSAGERVSGIFGMLRMIHGLVERFRPSEFCVIWDGGRSSARKSLYPGYKKKPSKDDDVEKAEFRRQEFSRQTNELFEHLPMFGVKQIKVPKTEADDVIALLTQELVQLDIQPMIVSTDNDYLQLLSISDAVLVYSPTKNILYDNAMFTKEYGFPASRMLEFKAMIGDSSDMIEGIKGFGGKTATDLIQKSTSIAQYVSDHADELLKSKKMGKLVTEWETVVRNMALMDLRNPCVDDVEGLRVASLIEYANAPVNFLEHSKIQRFLSRHSFNSIMRDYTRWIMEFEMLVARSKMVVA